MLKYTISHNTTIFYKLFYRKSFSTTMSKNKLPVIDSSASLSTSTRSKKSKLNSTSISTTLLDSEEKKDIPTACHLQLIMRTDPKSKLPKPLVLPEPISYGSKFFKTKPGDYSENDLFLYNLNVPEMRKLAQSNIEIELDQVNILLKSKYNDERFLGLLVLVEKYKVGDTNIKKIIYDYYISNFIHINNWNLVDCSCYFIMGDYLLDNDRSILYKLAISDNIWERRISIVTTMAFIRKNQFDDTFNLALILINDKQDLIHKACGWLIREAGKKDVNRLTTFLDEYATKMPRTMLRYAIEKYSPSVRKEYLNKN